MEDVVKQPEQPNDIGEKPIMNDPKTGHFVEGNPGGGRPKGSGISITTEIKKKLAEVPEGQRETYLQLLVNRIFKQAIQDGDSQMIGRVWAYIDGMPKQSVEVGHTDDIVKQITDRMLGNEQIPKASERVLQRPSGETLPTNEGSK